MSENIFFVSVKILKGDKWRQRSRHSQTSIEEKETFLTSQLFLLLSLEITALGSLYPLSGGPSLILFGVP